MPTNVKWGLIPKLISILVLLCIILSGCTPVADLASDSKSNTNFNMEYGLDAGQYCLFVCKQINAIVTQTSSTMIVVHDVRSNGYSANKACESLKSSLEIIQDAKNEIEFMAPPEQYRENYDNVIRIIADIEMRYSDMIRLLESSKPDIALLEATSEDLSTDASALSAEANVYYK